MSIREPGRKKLENPKSMILMSKFLSSRIFSGFKSLEKEKEKEKRLKGIGYPNSSNTEKCAPVNDIVRMAVFQRRNDLPKDPLGLLFLHALFAHNVVKELSTTCVLHDHENFSWGVDDIVEGGDVGVLQQFDNQNFSQDPFNVFLVCNRRFFETFYRELAEAKSKVNGGLDR